MVTTLLFVTSRSSNWRMQPSYLRRVTLEGYQEKTLTALTLQLNTRSV